MRRYVTIAYQVIFSKKVVQYMQLFLHGPHVKPVYTVYKKHIGSYLKNSENLS